MAKKAAPKSKAPLSRASRARLRRAMDIKSIIKDMASFTLEEFRKFRPIAVGYYSNEADACRAQSRNIITKFCLDEIPENFSVLDNFLFALACMESDATLKNYSTLDDDQSANINEAILKITEYIGDSSKKRPLNLLMYATPGAGKSHFIDCIAKQLKDQRVEAITFNLASMSAADELVRPLDEARDAKVEDRFPLLFLDEFDSSDTNYPLLLPLLWDGAISIAQRDIKLGKIIIVLAGSNPNLPDILEHAKSMRSNDQLPSGTHPKQVDLFSRINGCAIHIPPFFDPNAKVDRRTDKVVIAAKLLSHRFGSQLQMVPLGLFRFIAGTQFRYNVRSIVNLIELIPYRKNATKIRMNQLKLPLNSVAALRKSSLAYHLIDNEESAHGIVNFWKESSKCDHLVPITVGDAWGRRRFMYGYSLPEDMLSMMMLESVLDLENEYKMLTRPKRTRRKKPARKK